MKKIICLITSLVGLAAFSGAQADDFYAGAFGGANWIQNNHHHQHARAGYLVGADVGYRWCNGFRTELEFSYRNNRRHYNNGDSNSTRRHTNVYAGLVNVLYDFDYMGCWCIKPFIGAGIGAASEKRNNYSSSTVDSSSSNSSKRRSSFAWQLIAGLGYPLNDCVDLSLSYRFFKTRERLNNHGLALGVNYNF